MSYPSSTMPSTISSFEERQWVIQIRRTLDEKHDEEDFKTPVSIFSIPKTLLAYDPDAYIPHQVPVGPYHYWRPEMYEMERYKLAAAKRLQQHLKHLMFEDVVLQLTRHEMQIRACYHKCLSCNGETLAWMMAVDACSLLEFLQIFVLGEDGKLLHKKPSRMSRLVDIKGRKSAHNAILRDMVMLENQIPLFALRKLAEMKFSSPEMADNMLFQMLMGFLQVLSPFNIVEELQKVEAMECAHILDFVYHFIVPRLEPRQTNLAAESSEGKDGEGRTTLRSASHIRKLLDEVWKIFSRLNKGPIRIIKNVLSSKVVMFLTKLPWTIISNIPGIKLLKGPIESLLCFSQDKLKEKVEILDDDKPPFLEEIAIPSVTDLSKACVNFSPTEGGISSIKFDSQTCTFYLPTISIDEKTEVLFKNLVAYEACNATGPVIFTRYTELMNGIIDTEEDAKILREKGIILNRLKSDKEVEKLWNGMNRSVRLTKAPHLDKVIGDMNKFYDARRQVKLRKFLKRYVYGSRQFLTLLACVLLLLLMSFQAFCSVYNCERNFHIQVSEES